jgi:hypothetical protein
MLAIYERTASLAARVHDWCFVAPLQRVYLKAYWLGLPPEQICATLTGVASNFWERGDNQEECWRRINNNFEGWRALLDYGLINLAIGVTFLMVVSVFVRFLFCRHC